MNDARQVTLDVDYKQTTRYAVFGSSWETVRLHQTVAQLQLSVRAGHCHHHGVRMQALYLQPDNITAHYRLAQACFHVRQYKQCLNACQAALKIKPGARQPRQLHQLAADLIRSDFLTHRNPEVEQAIAATSQAALQEV